MLASTSSTIKQCSNIRQSHAKYLSYCYVISLIYILASGSFWRLISVAHKEIVAWYEIEHFFQNLIMLFLQPYLQKQNHYRSLEMKTNFIASEQQLPALVHLKNNDRRIFLKYFSIL